MNTIPAKTIISKKQDDSWFGTDYNMNIYKGCCHGCIYCDSRSDCYQISDFDTVRAKDNAIAIIEDELRRKHKSGVIGTGSMSDPYNPYEQRYHLTRQALQLLDQYHFGVAIATKGALVARDIDVLTRIRIHSPVIVKITITSYDDELARKLEPSVSCSSDRFEAVRKLSEAGIYTGLLMMPLLPSLTATIDNVMNIIHTAHRCGAKFIYPWFGLSLRTGQREYLYQKLEQLFPGQNLKKTYENLYGMNYSCQSPNANDLYKAFTEECTRLGISYRMDEIIKGYKTGYDYQQLSLF